jgi:hypothetical protein
MPDPIRHPCVSWIPACAGITACEAGLPHFGLDNACRLFYKKTAVRFPDRRIFL